jgi:hypothetical protein
MELRRQHDSPFGRSRYRVIGDGCEFFSCVRRGEALPYLEWGINRAMIARAQRFLLLHAAGAVLRGQTILLVGPSGSGKSTIATALLAGGWSLLGDEIAMIDPETLRAYPFPKAVCIKSHGFEPLERIGLGAPRRRHYVRALKTHVGHVAIPEGRVAEGNRAVTHIVLPTWTGSRNPELRRIPRAQAALALTSQILNRAEFGSRQLGVIAGLVAGADCFELRHGEISATIRALSTLTASLPRD